jgi:hypothetical protein
VYKLCLGNGKEQECRMVLTKMHEWLDCRRSGREEGGKLGDLHGDGELKVMRG